MADQRSSTASGGRNGMNFLLKFTYSPCKFQIEYQKSVYITENSDIAQAASSAMQCAAAIILPELIA